MARIRTIKPDYWTDEKVGTFNRDVRLIYIAMWTYSDDSGVLRGNMRLLKSQILPYDDDVTLNEFTNWVNTLIDGGMLIQLIYKNENYLYIRTFLEHQKIDKPSKPIIDSDTLSCLLDEYSTNTRRIFVPVIVSSNSSKEIVSSNRIGRKKERVFAPPFFEDIFNFFIEKKWPDEKSKFQAQKFIDHYTSNGWKVGKVKMVSWKSAASGWMNRQKEFDNEKQKNNQNGKTNQGSITALNEQLERARYHSKS